MTNEERGNAFEKVYRSGGTPRRILPRRRRDRSSAAILIVLAMVLGIVLSVVGCAKPCDKLHLDRRTFVQVENVVGHPGFYVVITGHSIEGPQILYAVEVPKESK